MPLPRSLLTRATPAIPLPSRRRLAARQGRGEVAAKALAQLKRVAPTHALLEARAVAEGQFDRVAETFAS